MTYAREPGFYLGAMYFSYLLGILLAAPTTVGMFLYGHSATAIGVAVTLQLVAFAPLLFRYSRVVWMHFDQLVDPR